MEIEIKGSLGRFHIAKELDLLTSGLVLVYKYMMHIKGIERRNVGCAHSYYLLERNYANP